MRGAGGADRGAPHTVFRYAVGAVIGSAVSLFRFAGGFFACLFFGTAGRVAVRKLFLVFVFCRAGGKTGRADGGRRNGRRFFRYKG